MNRKLAAAAALTLTTLTSQAATLRVPQQHATIQAAVDAAAPGDTVLVGSGRYIENVLVQKSLTLRSVSGASQTIIDGNGIGAPLGVWGTLTETVSISGFTLTNSAWILDRVEVGYPNNWGAGLFVDSVASVKVFDNVISGNRGCSGIGIRTFESNVSIHDNVLKGNRPMDWCPGNGEIIRIGGSGTLTDSRDASVIRNRIVDNAGIGLSLVAFENAVVAGNTITDNGEFLDGSFNGGGIDFSLSGGLIANNLVARNKGGFAPGLILGNYNEPVHTTIVTGNRFLDNSSTGSVGAVSIVTLDPSNTQFFANAVIGDSSGTLVECLYSGSHVYANYVLNRNPQGAAVQCSP